jgi:predicted N-formylglutamate amidohydrolase
MHDAVAPRHSGAAFEAVDGAARPGLLLLCDHANNALPPDADGLGLAPERLSEHIAWDIGAADVTRGLARALGVPALLSGYSRLYIDCNRALGSPNSIPEESDGVAVPGNRELTPAARERRAEIAFHPYHDALLRRLDTMREPFVAASHSCTPVFGGVARPWHVGVLWRRDPDSARRLIAALARDTSLCVGENQPYSALDTPGYTVAEVIEPRGLSHVIIEIRQDLIATAEGVGEWSERLADIFASEFSPKEAPS